MKKFNKKGFAIALRDLIIALIILLLLVLVVLPGIRESLMRGIYSFDLFK